MVIGPRMKVAAIVALSVVIVLLLVLMTIGVPATADNIGADDDPTGQEREPIAYVVINMHATVKNVYDGFRGSVTNDVEVHDFVSALTVYHRWDPLSILEDDVKVYIETTLSGPGNYFVKWTSDKIEDSIPELYWPGDGDEHEYDFGPYTAKFFDPGQYTLVTALLVEWDEGWDEAHKIAQDSDSIQVS